MKINLITKFIFLLLLIFNWSLVYAQELKVLEHIPAKEIESYLYDAIPMGVRWTPVLGGWNLAISPNGKFIGFWSPKNLSVKVMDLETREIIAELDDADLKDLKKFTYTPIWSLAFTPDSKFLAIVLDKPSIVKLWDFKGPPSFSLKQTDAEKTTTQEKKETTKKVINLVLPDIDEEDLTAKKEPPQIAFSLDGKYLATSVVTKIYLWSTANWQIINSLKSPLPYGQERAGGARSITGLIFSPDSKYLVSRCGSQLSVWELYKTIETEEWKKWNEEQEKKGMAKAAGGMTGSPSSPMEETGKQMAETGKQMVEEQPKEPSRYVTIFSPHLFLPDIRSPHKVGNIGRSSLLFSPDGKYLIIGMLRFDFTPDEWKARLENGDKAEDITANFQRFDGEGSSDCVAVFKDLVATGAGADPNNLRDPARIFRLSDLKEIISFNTVKDTKSPDKTHLVFFFPDGKRLLTHNHLEGIYIFDISELKN